jgi:uncharacterized LabA/DUF88 family protein
MTRVSAYVDGWNLYHGVKAKFGRKYLWLDLVELVRRLRPQDSVVAVRYFTTIVAGEPAAAANQTQYLRALEANNSASTQAPRLEIKRGRFKRRTIPRCRQCGQHWHCGCVPHVRFRTYEEKETDVALGASLVEDAALGIADVMLLVSADSDFAPAVAAARRVAPQLHVILAMPPGNLQPHRAFTNVGSFSINETALRRSQLPECVADAGSGSVYQRPAKWT